MVQSPATLPEDIDVFGETSSTSYKRRVDENSLYTVLLGGRSMLSEETKDWVSPIEPKIHQILPALMKSLANTQGIAGIVFQDTAPLGYGIDDFGDIRLDLGYSLSNRIIFLRQNQADTSLLKECYTAAKSVKACPPLFMREQRDGQSITPWDDPGQINKVGEFDMPTDFDIPTGKEAPPLTVTLRDQNQNSVGMAVDLETGKSGQDVPTLLKSIAPHLIPPPSPAFNLLMKMLGLPEQ
jgi:hypothetical protein